MKKTIKTNILIVGGYGNFGKRIAKNLAEFPNLSIIIAGRNITKAEQLISTLEINSASEFKALAFDCQTSGFADILITIKPFLVIHTSGPFQGQQYQVAKACLEVGSHYIDLADDRRFVCDVVNLNQKAIAKNLLLVSGASTVPGLSSVVLDHFSAEFNTIESIDMAIAPGNQAERGEATIAAILSYTGRPFKVLIDGKWVKRYGWMNSRKIDFGGFIGKRRLANVDVPELELFAERYSGIKTIQFQAGLELGILHWTMVYMAYLARWRIIKNWAFLSKIITKISNYFQKFGTDQGGMKIVMSGVDLEDKPKQIIWTLFADNGIGPYIPMISTILLTKNLLSGKLDERGAKSCLGMYSLKEFTQFCETLDIYHTTEIKNG